MAADKRLSERTAPARERHILKRLIKHCTSGMTTIRDRFLSNRGQLSLGGNMRRSILITILGCLVLSGCGMQENTGTSSTGAGFKENLVITTQPLEETTSTKLQTVSAIVTGTNELMPIPSPMYDRTPRLSGERFTLDTRAFALLHDTVVDVPVGYEIQMIRPRTEGVYSLEFDPAKLTIITAADKISDPDEAGWIWNTRSAGQTRITITTPPPCPATIDACVTLPLIRYSVMINVK